MRPKFSKSGAQKKWGSAGLLCNRLMATSSMNTLELFDRLIGFPTVSRDSNLDLIDFVSAFLQERSASVRLFKSSDGKKANLYATIGPRENAGVLLSGHSDVVPVDGQDWQSNPFKLTQRAGSMYGRGTADMKGFLACALSAADRASRLTLHRPLHLAISYDEEIGCVGVRSLIKDMQSWTAHPTVCIVGEPTLMKVAVGHKGKTALKVTCTGHSVHSALAPQGINAIHLASDLVQRLRTMQDFLEKSGTHDPGYEVPYTTVHVGRLIGGTALNIVPDRCQMEVEIRNVSRDAPAQFIERIRTFAAEIERQVRRPEIQAGISVEITNEYPGLNTSESAEVANFVSGLAGDEDRIRVAFGSEAGLFSGIGIPTVLCGPGSIVHAHRPNEFIAEDQLARCDTMMNRLLKKLS